MSELYVPDSAIRIPQRASDDQILDAVRDWVNALSQENYDRAFVLTAHETYYQWTPALLRKTIEGYGLPEPHPKGPFKVSPIETAAGHINPRHVVERFSETTENSPIGEIWFDLPLNGNWSDLTATFTIHRWNDGLVIALSEVHVF